MSITELMSRQVDTARASDTAQAAAQRMGARNVGTLVVADAERKALGIVTDRDLALRVVGAGLDPNRVPVGDVMTRNPVTIQEEDSPDEALGLMRLHSTRRLPVVDQRGTMIGIVSSDDLLTALARELSAIEELVSDSCPDAVAR